MKHLTTLLKVLIAAILVSLTSAASAECVGESNESAMESVEISLLTCGPGQEVYSLYGHTAIRYQNKAMDTDIVTNYGMFSFSQRFFILRFVFGLTDYEMGIQPFSHFLQTYMAEGRWVKQQTLNLTNEEKFSIVQALDINYRPDNRVYRYNYFYDNCTTRARDMIVSHIQGRVTYPEAKGDATYRSMIHQWNEQKPWSRLGNDLLLGVKADLPTDKAQRQFLPDSLRYDFDHAFIVANDGSKRKLVKSTEYLYLPPTADAAKEFPLSPTACAWIVFATIIVVGLVEWKTRKICWGLDALLLMATGVAGLILFAMIFSQHPTVSLNFQILALCPLSILFAYPTVKKLRKHQLHRYLLVWALLVVLMLILGIFQKYSPAIYIVALSLLVRIATLRYWCKHTYPTK